MSFDSLFNKTIAFKDCELLLYETGEVKVKAIINASNANPYGKAHGGYLYTLCDSLAGLTAFSSGAYVVTLQANINYIKQACIDDELYLQGRTVHNGKSTIVVDVNIHNQEGKLIAKANFTMYVMKKVEE